MPITKNANPVTMRSRLVELVKFGVVGGLGFVVDLGLSNLLQHGPLAVLAGKPIPPKIAAACVALPVTCLGNRLRTLPPQRPNTPVREFVGRAVPNGGGLAIGVLCLWISHYVLGLTSPLADNISANGVGLVLGTAFRYFSYKYLVFTGSKPTLDPTA